MPLTKAFGSRQCTRATKTEATLCTCSPSVHPSVCGVSAEKLTAEPSSHQPQLSDFRVRLLKLFDVRQEKVKRGNANKFQVQQMRLKSAEEGSGLAWTEREGRQVKRHGFDLTEPCDQQR